MRQFSCCPDDDIDIFISLFDRESIVLQKGGISTDGGERGLEFMGDTGDKIRVKCLSAVQFLHHMIKIGQKIMDLTLVRICIQFYIFPLNFMSTIYFLFGLCQAATGYAAWIFLQQESFRVDPADYPHIGADPRRLVVCFSRMGYVRKQALAEADRTGAAVYEIRAAERTAGTLGFWWCGRYGMHRWPMPIEPVGLDLAAYDHVTICAPIWVFALAAPVRSFCMQAAGRIREADYLLVHHTRGRYENAAREMDALLGLTHTGFRTLQCHTGHYRTR